MPTAARRAPARAAADRVARVLLEDPELMEPLDGAELRAAGQLAVRAVLVRPGAWTPRTSAGPRRALGLLVMSGWVVRRTLLPWGPVAELFGPGDLLRPWAGGADSGGPRTDVSWEVLEPSELALLDGRFMAQLAAFPGLAVSLLDRQEAHMQSAVVQLAAAASKQLDDALLLLMAHLTSRWGRVRLDGLHLPLPLGHRLLSEMVGARRPSVSVALKRLGQSRALRRLPDRTWLLAPDHAQRLRRPEQAPVSCLTP